MSWIGIRVGDDEFYGRCLLDDAALRQVCPERPGTLRLVQDEWSGALLKTVETVEVAEPATLGRIGRLTYQYPGLLGFEPVSGRYVLAYGGAKSQTCELLRPVIPLAEVEGGLGALMKICHAVQFDGAIELKISTDRDRPADDPPATPDFVVVLGKVTAEAVFVPNACPVLVKSFMDVLPLEGTATNTHSGGPLTRFWNSKGGPEGETPLSVGPDAERSMQQVLYPRHMYYLPKEPWRGIRMALREPTIMRSAVAGGANSLLPLARILGDTAELGKEAASLVVVGRKRLRFEAP